jgi:hypothetical protein
MLSKNEGHFFFPAEDPAVAQPVAQKKKQATCISGSLLFICN